LGVAACSGRGICSAAEPVTPRTPYPPILGIARAGHLVTRLGMIALRGYLVIGALLLVVKAVELSRG
jgi:hypothetical protein